MHVCMCACMHVCMYCQRRLADPKPNPILSFFKISIFFKLRKMIHKSESGFGHHSEDFLTHVPPTHLSYEVAHYLLSKPKTRPKTRARYLFQKSVLIFSEQNPKPDPKQTHRFCNWFPSVSVPEIHGHVLGQVPGKVFEGVPSMPPGTAYKTQWKQRCS